ncbi:unnamed protein product, partial [marine sediment metagenome]
METQGGAHLQSGRTIHGSGSYSPANNTVTITPYRTNQDTTTDPIAP